MSNLGVNGVGMTDYSQQKSSVAKGAITAAAVGAGVHAGANYAAQKIILKNPDYAKSTLDFYKSTTQKINMPTLKNTIKKEMKTVKDILKSGKVNWKQVGKSGAIGAAAFAGVYLAYKGIKSMFS